MNFAAFFAVHIYRHRDEYVGIVGRKTLHFRIFSFTCILLIVMIFAVWQPSDLSIPGRYILSNISLAILPLSGAIVFGTTTDILRMWACRRKSKMSEFSSHLSV
ncbi:hypothetical protein CVT26_013521 [Gymnopilus dilepis]|uniref:Uncharacterized protein n=1 Tax=Gymnopilus dilepis TaxID=231916 RepID=A0A409Y5G8_9AGAR|nr:hypothetical protein CVT26_013521 [Gymnopilus dilepis]